MLISSSYVSSLERRVASLEKFIRAKHPEVDLDEVVAASQAGSVTANESISVFAATDSYSENKQIIVSPPPVSFTPIARLPTPESLPNGSDGFDWGKGEHAGEEFEDTQGPSGNMDGVGYLGTEQPISLV